MKKILIVLCAIAMTGCLHLPDSRPIVIGGLVPLEGSNVLYGEWAIKTINLRIKQVNDLGGINGRSIEIVWANGMCNRETSMAAATELIDKHNVKAIFGGFCSEETLGAAPIAEENEVVLLSPLSTSPEISDAGNFVFRTAPSNENAGQLLADYAHKNNINKVGIIQESGNHNTMKETFQRKFNGDSVVVYLNEDDILQRLKEEKVEAILVNITSFKALNDLVAKLSGVDFGVPIFLNEVMTGAIEVMATYREVPFKSEILGVTFDVDATNPELGEFMDLYEEEIGKSLSFARFLGMGLDGIDVLTNALRNAENLNDGDSIRQAMNMTSHMGYSGLLRFDENGDVNASQVLLRFDGKDFISTD